MTEGISRRTTLTGAAALGVGIPLLTGCGGDSGSEDDAAPAAGQTLGPSADVPVGGGTIYADAKVVVTQPTNGEFKGFSAICTHQHCLVTKVEGGTIDCTCHGSRFSIQDGSVTEGPATAPLPAVAVKVSRGSLTTE